LGEGWGEGLKPIVITCPPHPNPLPDRTRVYPSSALSSGRSRIYPTSAGEGARRSSRHHEPIAGPRRLTDGYMRPFCREYTFAFGELTIPRYRCSNGSVHCLVRTTGGDCIWLLLVNAARCSEEQRPRRLQAAPENCGELRALDAPASIKRAGDHVCGERSRGRPEHSGDTAAEERGRDRTGARKHSSAATPPRL
jgi:hypothetical protein